MVTEGDLNLGGKYTMQHRDDVLQKCTLEAYNLINQCHPNKQYKTTP